MWCSLYYDHGTCEQFYSQIKSELDLVRLPSGKYETNGLVLHFGVFAYNLLRLIEQESLKNSCTIEKRKQHEEESELSSRIRLHWLQSLFTRAYNGN